MNPKTIGDEVVKALGKMRGENSFAVCPRGTYGHPNVDPAPRTASPDLLERAMAAYQFTRPDNRFANLVSRFYRFMSW